VKIAAWQDPREESCWTAQLGFALNIFSKLCNRYLFHDQGENSVQYFSGRPVGRVFFMEKT